MKTIPWSRLLTIGVVLSLSPMALLAQEISPELYRQGGVDVARMLVMRAVPLTFLLLLVTAVLIYASVREKRRNELLARFIDKGQEIPAELLPRQPSRHGAQRAGVLLIAFALGLGLLIVIMTREIQPAAWCLIPLFLGAASFINAAFLYPDSRR